MKSMDAILIDPFMRTVTHVIAGPYPEWKGLIEASDINAVQVLQYPSGAYETVWVNGEGLLTCPPDGPFFRVASHPQPMYGKGIVLGTDLRGETISTKLSAAFMKELIEWPDVIFEGMKEIEPHEQDHPVFGKVNVFGSEAQFRQMTAAEKKRRNILWPSSNNEVNGETD